jgi:hypothetical protein
MRLNKSWMDEEIFFIRGYQPAMSKERWACPITGDD